MNSARKTKRRLKKHKPHNPLVAPAMRRKAGSHRKSEAALRHAQKIALQKSIVPSEE